MALPGRLIGNIFNSPTLEVVGPDNIESQAPRPFLLSNTSLTGIFQ